MNVTDQQPISSSRSAGNSLKVVAIINPVAGANKQRAAIRRMVGLLKTAGMQVELKATTSGDDALQFAAAAATYADAVIAIGGDGTVRDVANGLIGSRVPMLVWPTGTENLVAKSLGFRPDPESVLETIQRQCVEPMDVGVANGRTFLVVAGIGFDAEVVDRLTRSRTGHITHFHYVGPLWRTFWEHRFPPLRVSIEGQTRWEGRGMVFVGNMARYAFGLPVVRDAVTDDGLLDLCILPCTGCAGVLAHALRTLRRVHIEHPSVHYQRVRQVRIESAQRIPYELDGDNGGCLPLDIQIHPSRLPILVPPRTRG